MSFSYRAMLRPVGRATLPDGVRWEYAAVPPYVTLRPDLPSAPTNAPHGIITLDRALSLDECRQFGMVLA